MMLMIILRLSYHQASHRMKIKQLLALIEATDADTNTEFTYTISGTDADSISVSEDGDIELCFFPGL